MKFRDNAVIEVIITIYTHHGEAKLSPGIKKTGSQPSAPNPFAENDIVRRTGAKGNRG